MELHGLAAWPAECRKRGERCQERGRCTVDEAPWPAQVETRERKLGVLLMERA